MIRPSSIGFALALGCVLWLLPGAAAADTCEDGECINGYPYQVCTCVDDTGMATCKYYVADGQQFDCTPIDLPSGGLDFDCKDAEAGAGAVCCSHGGSDFCPDSGGGSSSGSGSSDPGGGSDGGAGGDAGSSEGDPSSGESSDPPRDDCATPPEPDPDPVTTEPPGLCGDLVCRRGQVCCDEECVSADQECTLVPSRFGPGRGRFATGCSAAGAPGEGWAGTMVVAAALLLASRRRRARPTA
jgi:uncharacterized protein (TIGR03382 family)